MLALQDGASGIVFSDEEEDDQLVIGKSQKRKALYSKFDENPYLQDDGDDKDNDDESSSKDGECELELESGESADEQENGRPDDEDEEANPLLTDLIGNNKETKTNLWFNKVNN